MGFFCALAVAWMLPLFWLILSHDVAEWAFFVYGVNVMEGLYTLVSGVCTENKERDIAGKNGRAPRKVQQLRIVFSGKPGEAECSVDLDGSAVASRVHSVPVDESVVAVCKSFSGVKDGRQWTMYEIVEVFIGKEAEQIGKILSRSGVKAA